MLVCIIYVCVIYIFPFWREKTKLPCTSSFCIHKAELQYYKPAWASFSQLLVWQLDCSLHVSQQQTRDSGCLCNTLGACHRTEISGAYVIKGIVDMELKGCVLKFSTQADGATPCLIMLFLAFLRGNNDVHKMYMIWEKLPCSKNRGKCHSLHDNVCIFYPTSRQRKKNKKKKPQKTLE